MNRLDLRILPGFKPVTRLAIKWKQLANGSYICVDRENEGDIYESNISVYGRESEINALIRMLEDNRQFMYHSANTFELSDFNAAEMIFGAEVDYSRPIKALAAKIGAKEQKSWRGFSLKLTLRALNVSPNNNIAPKFPDINALCDKNENSDAGAPHAFLAVGFTGDSVINMQKGDTYTGEPNFSDMRGDSGYFEGTFTLNTADMASLRKYLTCGIRGEVIPANSDEGKIISQIPGVQNLFGVRRGGVGHKFDVRITEWADMGMKSLGFWQIKMKIVEEIGYKPANGGGE